jgi:hypothetical protein
MASYDSRVSTAHGEARLARPLRLSWSALFGGSLIGWGTLFVLSLAGASIGLANVTASDYASVVGDRLAGIGVGVGIWGLVAMVAASFVGAFFVVRIAGDRRRREGMLHAAVSWGLSAVALALLTLSAVGGAAGAAGQSAALRSGAIQSRIQARETVPGDPGSARLTPREQVALEDSARGAAKTAAATAGALGLSFVFALFGALVACSLLSGRKLVDELKIERHGNGGHLDRDLRPSLGSEYDRARDLNHPTILPPTH